MLHTLPFQLIKQTFFKSHNLNFVVITECIAISDNCQLQYEFIAQFNRVDVSASEEVRNQIVIETLGGMQLFTVC